MGIEPVKFNSNAQVHDEQHERVLFKVNRRSYLEKWLQIGIHRPKL